MSIPSREEQVDMFFDELVKVVYEFASPEWDLSRSDLSWVVGQLRLEIDDTGMDFEAEIDDPEDPDLGSEIDGF